MKLFNWGSSKGDDVPAWANFVDARTFARLKTAVTRTTMRRYPLAVFDWELGYWLVDDHSEQQCGLTNLMQMAAQTAPRDLDEMIDGFVSAVGETYSGPKELSFEQAREMIKIRLWPLDVPPMPFVKFPICDSFITTLVLDLPDVVKSLNRDQVKDWPVTDDELFKIGLENVFKQDEVEVTRAGPDGVPITFLAGESFFTATHALALDRYVAFDPSKGLIVSMPNRHIVAFAEVSKDASAVLPVMVGQAENLFTQGPGSITPDVLWFHDGRFEKIDVSLKGRIVEFRGPAGLGVLLKP